MTSLHMAFSLSYHLLFGLHMANILLFFSLLAPESHQRMPCLPPPGSCLFPVPAAYFRDRNGKTYPKREVGVLSVVNEFNLRNCFTSAAIAVTFTSRRLLEDRRIMTWRKGERVVIGKHTKGHEELHYSGVCTQAKRPRFRAFGCFSSCFGSILG